MSFNPGFMSLKNISSFNAVSSVELYLLGGGVQNVPFIAGIYLKRPVSPRLCIGNQDFTKLICLEIA